MRKGKTTNVTDNLKSFEKLNIINRKQQKLNFQHKSILEEGIDLNKETFYSVVNNNKLFYTESISIKKDSLEETLYNYVL